jgi:ADP-ribose pyrophosphatase YjhB (NUDIX family)
MVVGCIVEWDERLLLCRRAVEPRDGFWTTPAGYLENGETLSERAKREVLEEAQAKVEILAPYALLEITYVNQMYLIFRSRMLNRNFGPTIESSEVRLFKEEEIPWDEIAFTSIHESLRLYFEDRSEGRFGFHMGIIPPREKGGNVRKTFVFTDLLFQRSTE